MSCGSHLKALLMSSSVWLKNSLYSFWIHPTCDVSRVRGSLKIIRLTNCWQIPRSVRGRVNSLA